VSHPRSLLNLEAHANTLGEAKLHKGSRMRHAYKWLGLWAVVAVTACGTNPVTKKPSFSLYRKRKKSQLVHKITPQRVNRKVGIM